MRHLISPLDLSLDETNQLLDLAGRIIDDPINVRANSLPLCFMNPAPAPV